jgi:hypothetical protein
VHFVTFVVALFFRPLVEFRVVERLTGDCGVFRAKTPWRTIVKYLCLIYDNEAAIAGMPKGEADAFMGEYFGFTEDIKKSGHYIGGEALKPVNTATTIRMRNGKLSTTDGPFAETKEQLGGFYLIEAKDLNDAMQVASRIPSVRTGSIEIRPVEVFG